jgi:hypothetical protein
MFSRNRPSRFAAYLTACCVGLFMHAAEPDAGETEAADPDVPQPFDPTLVSPLLEHPPFTRALNLSESLLLTGVAYMDGKPVATIKDMSTNKSYVVSEEPNALGWRLAEAIPSMRLDRAEVKLMIGSEIVAVRYSDTQMIPQRRSSGGSSRSSGAYSPSRPPTPEEFMGRDEKGAYVKASPYLSEQDRDKMRNMPRETREKFINIVHDARERMLKSSHDERATIVKKVFDAVNR